MKQLYQGECKWFWLIGITALAAAALIAGCSPLKRLNRLAAAHPEATASICARMYPVRENSAVRVQTVVDTMYRPGPVIYIDCDSANMRREPGDTSRLIVHVPCPPAQLIRTLVTKDSIVRVENTAALAEARNQASAAEIAAAKAGKARQMWMWAAIGLFAYSIIRLVLRRWLKIVLP